MTRKAFNFYRSYYEIALELPEKDRLDFLMAIIKVQFGEDEPELTGMSKFAYISQKHSINKQLEGYKNGLKGGAPPKGNDNPPPKGEETIPPKGNNNQVQEKGEVQEKEEEQVQDKILFETFWKLYPNKVGKAKCEPKWEKLTNDIRKKIIETLPAFVSYKPFPTYNHPNPETYLNQKRWEDEIPKIEAPKGNAPSNIFIKQGYPNEW